MKHILLNIFFCFVLSVSYGLRSSAYAASVDKDGHRSSVNENPSSVNCQLPTVNSDLSSIDRTAYYKAMQGEDKGLVNAQLTALESATPPLVKDAFMGAMTMKKAGLGGSPTTKLSLFKQGHKMLETAIKEDPNNAEYRFLRLMIQENAPGILGYKNDTEKDSEYIRKSYKSLPGDVQQAIADYNKKSKLLKLEVS
jgi:hypothetical protein